MDPEAIKLFWILTAIGCAGGLVFGIVSIVNVVVKRLAGPDQNPAAEHLEYLRERAEQVELLEERVAELENRMEFAERLLPAPGPDEITPLPEK